MGMSMKQRILDITRVLTLLGLAPLAHAHTDSVGFSSSLLHVLTEHYMLQTLVLAATSIGLAFILCRRLQRITKLDQ